MAKCRRANLYKLRTMKLQYRVTNNFNDSVFETTGDIKDLEWDIKMEAIAYNKKITDFKITKL